MAERPEYSPGLAGVIAGESAISRIDFEANRLIVRGYDLVEITRQAVFEEVAWLLLYGELPTAAQLGEFQDRLRAERGLPPMVEELLRRTPAEAQSMAVLRSAVSALGVTDPEARDISREATLRKAERLLAKVPTILAAAHRCARAWSRCPPTRPWATPPTCSTWWTAVGRRSTPCAPWTWPSCSTPSTASTPPPSPPG